NSPLALPFGGASMWTRWPPTLSIVKSWMSVVPGSFSVTRIGEPARALSEDGLNRIWSVPCTVRVCTPPAPPAGAAGLLAAPPPGGAAERELQRTGDAAHEALARRLVVPGAAPQVRARTLSLGTIRRASRRAGARRLQSRGPREHLRLQRHRGRKSWRSLLV